MAKLTDEEKKQAIEEFIENNQKKYFLVKSAVKALGLCTGDTMRAWCKSLYGMPTSELFTTRGVLVETEEDMKTLARQIFGQLKAAYDGKEPAKCEADLETWNRGICVRDYFAILPKLADHEEFGLFEAVKCGILEDLYPSEDSLKAGVDGYVSRCLKEDRHFLTSAEAVKSFFLQTNLQYPLLFSDRQYHESLMERIPAAVGKQFGEYLTDTGLVLPREKAMQEVLNGLREKAKEMDGRKVESPEEITLVGKYHDAVSFLYEEAAGNGLTGEKADGYVRQIFIDAGLMEGEKTAAAIEEDIRIEAAEKKERDALAAEEERKMRLYGDIDAVDVEALAESSGVSGGEFPADKQPKVTLDGTTFTVQFGLKRTLSALSVSWPKDAKAAYETMLTREQVQERIQKEDPNFRSDAYDLATPEFAPGNEISRETAERRFLFLKAVGALLQRPDILEALVRFAPKKKNGTFYKNRVVRIASSMVAESPNSVFEITGRLKDDTRMYVAFEEAVVTPENYEKSRDDFVSNNWELFI